MKKVLKIRFVKFERALAMQILEQKGKFASGKHTRISASPELECGDTLYLRGCSSLCDFRVCLKSFKDNNERDEYLEKVIKWISGEQFAMGGMLEVGKKCEASDDNEDWVRRIFAGEADEQFGEPRFLALGLESSLMLRRWRYVRPLASSVRPKIDGDVYTWEMEVAE